MSHQVRTALSCAAGKLNPKIPWIIQLSRSTINSLLVLLLLEKNIEDLGQFRSAHLKIPPSLDSSDQWPIPVPHLPGEVSETCPAWADKYLEHGFGEPGGLPSPRSFL